MILKDVGFNELAQLVEYMYTGQISVRHQDIQQVLQAAQALQVCIDTRIYNRFYRLNRHYKYA